MQQDLVADIKVSALFSLISTLYSFYPDHDIYVPKHQVVSGTVMRDVMDIISGWGDSRGIDSSTSSVERE